MRINKIVIGAFLGGVISSFLGGTLGLMAASPYTQERTEKVFIYGPLESPVIRAYACVCFTEPKPAELPGYTRGIRTLIPSSSNTLRGHLIAVSKTELARLDGFHKVPGSYYRKKLRVGRWWAWVYLKQD